MSGYINVRSEFDKAVEVTEGLLFLHASVGLLQYTTVVHIHSPHQYIYICVCVSD